jgi:hypothetical protein
VAEPEPVGVRDLEVADRIARAVRRGQPADRHPTLEQLLSAFDASDATPEARRRAARALALAGVATLPDLLEAAPGDRIALEVRSVRRGRPLLLGLIVLVAVLAGAAALASTLDTSSNETVSDLPSGTTTTTSTPTTTAAPAPSTTSTTTSTPTTTTPTQPTAAEKRRARRAREKRAREKRAAAARAAAKRRVTVRLTASQATFLCVEGDGRQLYDGTLSGSQTFRAKVVRLNIGLGPTTKVTANGKPVPLGGSPAGVQITPRGHTSLPLGSRPCA